MLDVLVDDPRFGSRVRDIFAAATRTRRDAYRYGAESYGLGEEMHVHKRYHKDIAAADAAAGV